MLVSKVLDNVAFTVENWALCCPYFRVVHQLLASLTILLNYSINNTCWTLPSQTIFGIAWYYYYHYCCCCYYKSASWVNKNVIFQKNSEICIWGINSDKLFCCCCYKTVAIMSIKLNSLMWKWSTNFKIMRGEGQIKLKKSIPYGLSIVFVWYWNNLGQHRNQMDHISPTVQDLTPNKAITLIHNYCH